MGRSYVMPRSRIDSPSSNPWARELTCSGSAGFRESKALKSHTPSLMVSTHNHVHMRKVRSGRTCLTPFLKSCPAVLMSRSSPGTWISSLVHLMPSTLTPFLRSCPSFASVALTAASS